MTSEPGFGADVARGKPIAHWHGRLSSQPASWHAGSSPRMPRVLQFDPANPQIPTRLNRPSPAPGACAGCMGMARGCQWARRSGPSTSSNPNGSLESCKARAEDPAHAPGAPWSPGQIKRPGQFAHRQKSSGHGIMIELPPDAYSQGEPDSSKAKAPLRDRPKRSFALFVWLEAARKAKRELFR